MAFIPVITEAYPDELLYSWIYRLISANHLSPATFSNAYLGQAGIYSGELSYEIRHEYSLLCGSIHIKPDMAGFYYIHSTFGFDTMFLPRKTAMRYIRLVTMRSDETNPSSFHNFDKIYICPDCVSEDRLKFGEPYLHVVHHLGDIRYCPVHKRRLMSFVGKRSHECDFSMSDYKEAKTLHAEKAELAYAAFIQDIYKSEIRCVLEDVKQAFITKLHETGYSLRGNGYHKFEADLNGSVQSELLEKDARYCFDNYLIKKKVFSPRDMIPFLMFLFKDAGELRSYIQKDSMLLKNAVCVKCGGSYLSSYDNRFSMNMCPDCYMDVPVQEKFKNMVMLAGNGVYKAETEFASMNSCVEFRHSCGRITKMLPRTFIYGQGCCKCERRMDEKWDEYFELLKEYKRINGTTNIPKRMTYKGIKLGEWCQMMRKYKDSMPDDRRRRLADVGFDFDPNKSAWDKSFGIYKRYVKETGSGHVARGVIYEGFRLGEWYGNLKKRYQKGTMTAEQILQVKILYPDFPKSPDKPEKEPKQTKPHVRFEDAVVLLEQYYEEYDTHDIAKSIEYKGYKLGRWANQMRAKRKQGMLSKEQINRLNEAGFDWEPLKTKWERDLSRYKRYVEANEKTEVPKEAWFEHFAIGYWYSNLKISRKNGSLSEEQLIDILSIDPGFV